MRPRRIVRFRRRGTLPYCVLPPTASPPRIRNLMDAGLFLGRAALTEKRAMRLDGVRTCLKTRTVERQLSENAGSEEKGTDSIKEGRRRNSFLFYFFLYACSRLYAFRMRSVCVPYAYIFSLSALRTRLFPFLYALYAVNSGVVFSFSVHRFVFDCIQCIQTFLAGGTL